MLIKILLTLILLFQSNFFAQSSSIQSIASQDDLFLSLMTTTSIEDCVALVKSNEKLITTELYERLMTRGTERYTKDDYAKSLLLYQAATESAVVLNDKTRLSNALHQVGRSYGQLGQLTKAANTYLDAINAVDTSASQTSLVRILNDLAIAYTNQGNYKKATECAQQGYTLAEKHRDQNGVASGQLILGTISYKQGDYEQALTHFERSLVLFTTLQDDKYREFSLLNMGRVHGVRGNYIQAVQYFNQAAKLGENRPKSYMTIQTELGIIYTEQGDYENALVAFNKSLRIAETLNRQWTIASNQLGIGAAYGKLHDYDKALNYLGNSVVNAKSIGAQELVLVAESMIGWIYQQQGQYEPALDFQNKSLQMAQQMGDKRRTALILWRIGEIHKSTGDYHKALEFADQAASIADELRLPEISYLTLALKGNCYYARKESDRAADAFNRAIAEVEQLRSQVVGGGQARQLYLEQRMAPYHALVDLLMDQHRFVEALTYAERSKGRVLLDVLHSGKTDVTKAMIPAEREQERQLNKEVAALNTQIYRENRKKQSDPAKLKSYEEQLEKARAALGSFQTNLYAKYPELKAQRGHMPTITLDGIARLIPDQKLAVLEYVVTGERVYLLVLTKQGTSDIEAGGSVEVKAYRLNVTPHELTELVTEFRRRVTTHSIRFSQTGHQLYDLLIKPAEGQLQGKTTLCIVPDGVLWALPFQALQSATGYLIKDKAVFYAHSLSVLQEMLGRRAPGGSDGAIMSGERTLLAFANPSLGTETVESIAAAQRGKQFTPLPQAEKEARAIVNINGERQSRAYYGPQAQEALFKNEAGTYRLLHFATHALLNDYNPMYSYVLLAQNIAQGKKDDEEDGLLEGREIINLNLAADLVVLSACDTALGRIGAGEGVIGMSWAFFIAGTPATLASQWSVESTSTSHLMVEFYRNLVQTKSVVSSAAHKAEALRQSELKLLSSADYNHPYYWAGFALVGDPR